jgi:hypothetical protein
VPVINEAKRMRPAWATLKKKQNRKKNCLKKQKWAKNFHNPWSKEGIQMTKKHINRCSIPLVIREMQTKIIMKPGTCDGSCL